MEEAEMVQAAFILVGLWMGKGDWDKDNRTGPLLGQSLAPALLRAVPWLHLNKNLLVHCERGTGTNRED